MAAMAREYFAVDLRGLRPALAARAAERRMTESDVLRGALAAALDADPSIAVTQDTDFGGGPSPTPHTSPAPPVTASADRKAAAAALSQSSAELAILSRDINHLTQLLRRGAMDAALQYRERLGHLDGDVRSHLDKAATVLAECSSARIGARRSTPATAPRRSP